jgi:hypothetical protein
MIRTALAVLASLIACGCFELQFSGSSLCAGFDPRVSDPSEWPAECSEWVVEEQIDGVE